MRKVSVGAVSLASALLLASCSLILDFDDDGGSTGDSDASPTDAGPAGDGGDACAAFEPNESLQTAYEIDAGTYAPLGICPSGDIDFFSFTVDGTQDVLIEALFTNEPQMDLEMRLYNGSGMVIDRSETFDSNESIERSAASGSILAAGTYYIEIYGFNGTDTNTYTLELAITAP